MAAEVSATDISPSRHLQRFAFGALALKLNGQDEVVTREFVRTTILWLLDAAMKERLGRRDEDGDDFRSAGGRWI